MSHPEDARQRRLRQFANYRDEDRHECNLIAGRVNSLLTSQSLLAAALAVLYTYSCSGCADEKATLETAIALLALGISFLASLAIALGCNVLSRWHDHGNALLEQDEKGSGPGSAADRFLDGLNLPARRQNIPGEKFIVDVFNLGMPVGFGIAWELLIGRIQGPLWHIGLILFTCVWFGLLVCVWSRKVQKFLQF